MKETSQKLPCISCEPSLNWSLVLVKENLRRGLNLAVFQLCWQDWQSCGSRLNLYESRQGTATKLTEDYFLTCQTDLKLLFVTEKQLLLNNIRNDAT